MAFHQNHQQDNESQPLRLNLRIVLLIAVVVGFGAVLIYRLFNLQIVNGENYQSNFQLRIQRQISLPAARGNIYDRNGKLLAYNELSYSVTIRDLGDDSSSSHSEELNRTIGRALDIIEANGDTVNDSFDISLDEESGTYAFTVSGTQLSRFLADIYGHAKLEDLTEEEQASSAEDVVLYLAKSYSIGENIREADGSSVFEAGRGYTPERLLQVVSIRYLMSLNSYQKYIPTTIAYHVSDATVSAVSESADEMQGIDIADDTVRRYVDGKYFSQILGYTGTISSEELSELQAENPDYTANDQVGKTGIEQTLETTLQGTKGTKTVYVDNLGKELETISQVEPRAGQNVYLTIDKDLQEAAYDILEKKLAEIVVSRIRPIREYDTSLSTNAGNIVIPIYTVYYQMFNNNVLSMDHLASDDATDTEQEVYAAFIQYRDEVLARMEEELRDGQTPYRNLSKENQAYQSRIIQAMKDAGVLDQSRIDTDDETYQAWTSRETISMAEFLHYCITQNWVDASALDLGQEYVDSATEFEGLIAWIQSNMAEDSSFARLVYRYLILQDKVTGTQVCQLLLDQGVVTVPEAERASFEAGGESAYQFMLNRITNLDLTPAQLALDPCTGSMVITDVNNGEVLALVSYPSYDNNRMANGVDAEYFESLRQDLSSPLLNYATQQETAPGSTFKPVSATAGLMEGVISTSSTITCTGVFTKIGDPEPRCWIYPSAHGSLNVTEGIQHSCNGFFYEVGWRLGQEDDEYNSNTGTDKLAAYARMYGLGDKTGIEIDEAQPQISTQDAVRSAIGQGNADYTTVGLARYAATLANNGTCYNLTLIDRITDSDGTLVEDNSGSVKSQLNMSQSYWDAIHEGMKDVVDGLYFDLPVTVAGKTGTAQETTSRPNHALFICYAPYEKPQIACATRIANGYLSSYAAHITEDVLKYYYGTATREELVSGTEENVTDAGTLAGD